MHCKEEEEKRKKKKKKKKKLHEGVITSQLFGRNSPSLKCT